LLQGLLAEWHEELMSMSQRIIEVRSILRAELERIETPGAWNHIEEQIGTYA
jgi:aspartate aminotransferase